MAIRRKKKQQEETLVDIVEAKESAQDFIEANQKPIMGALLGLLVIIGGFFAYKYWYKAPREKEAATQMAAAQQQFERDSFAVALSNPGGTNMGFLDIVDNYGNTKAGNLAKYYAGVSYLHLGQYDAAIDYLKDFSGSGDVLPTTRLGLIGDAYSEKGDYDNALSFYQKAVNAGDNEFLTPIYLKKKGMLHEKNQEWEAAAKAYEQIKKKFPQSIDGTEIDKFLARVSAKL